MRRRHATLAPCTLLLAALLAPPAGAQSFGTEYVTFARGDLRIFATRGADTWIEMIDLDTGALATGLGPNPRLVGSAHDSVEIITGGFGQRHLRIRSFDGSGAGEAKPIVVWTGQLDNSLRHPPVPPSFPPGSNRGNPWMSYLPAIRADGAAAGAEVGREFIGFTSRDVYVIARKCGEPTLVVIEDVATNVDSDFDDSVVLNSTSPELIYSDSDIDAFFITGFEDDTIDVASACDASVLVGFDPQRSRDWTATPPSYAPGDDGSELGTEFYAFVHSGLSIFPTQDDTTVVVTDLTDQGSPLSVLDDSTSFTLADGDASGTSYDFWTVVTSNFSSGSLVPRSFPPLDVDILSQHPNPFENDIVKVVSDKPVLLYTGPIGSDVREFADVAYSVPTGTLDRLTYAFAQNGGADDLQIFAFDPTTQVSITSLTSGWAGPPVFHDFDIPIPTPWLGHPSISDRYWQSGIWRAELLRIESDKPITVINGDYDQPHFGAFIPFVRSEPLLPPIAVAEANPGQDCLGTAVELRGDASFDQDDDGPPPGIVGCTWDFDVSADSNGNFIPDDDVDSTDCVTMVEIFSCEPIVARLTVTDNEGETDTDDVTYTADDETPPTLDCPEPVVFECGPGMEQAYQDWLALFDCSDPCGTSRTVQESPQVFCGTTGPRTVAFTCADECDNDTTCGRTFLIEDTTPPQLTPGSIEPCYRTLEEAEAAALAATTAVDGCDADPTLSAETDLLGCDAVVTVTATDACGNFDVVDYPTTIDAGPPVVTPPEPLVLECDGRAGIPVSDPRIQDWLALATATDDCGPVTVTNDLSGVILPGCPPGEPTAVEFRSEDACGNVGLAGSSVVVIDTTAPDLVVPEPITLECNSPGGVPVDDPAIQAWLASANATDICGDATLENDAPMLFASGCGPDGLTTTVTFTSRDDCGLLTALSSTVTVVDSTPPDLVVPEPIVLECNSPGGVPLDDPQVQAWLGSAMASDACGNATLMHDALALFPSGCLPGETTVVTFTATDDCDLTTVMTSSITVVDTTPPDVEPSDQELACLWPPNHRYVCFDKDEFEERVAPLISDLCESEPITWRIESCLSDQPDDAKDNQAPGWNGDGKTENDCVVSPDGDQVCMRAERAGVGPADHGLPGPSAQDGRHYRLLIVAVDACGNESELTPIGHVLVPHDQSPEEKDCVDSNERGLKKNEPLPF